MEGVDVVVRGESVNLDVAPTGPEVLTGSTRLKAGMTGRSSLWDRGAGTQAGVLKDRPWGPCSSATSRFVSEDGVGSLIFPPDLSGFGPSVGRIGRRGTCPDPAASRWCRPVTAGDRTASVGP